MWTYQFVRSNDPELDEECLILAEVYYDRQGVPYGWCQATLIADDVAEARQVYEMMADAFGKQVLTDKDFIGDPYQ